MYWPIQTSSGLPSLPSLPPRDGSCKQVTAPEAQVHTFCINLPPLFRGCGMPGGGRRLCGTRRVGGGGGGGEAQQQASCRGKGPQRGLSRAFRRPDSRVSGSSVHINGTVWILAYCNKPITRVSLIQAMLPHILGLSLWRWSHFHTEQKPEPKAERQLPLLFNLLF